MARRKEDGSLAPAKRGGFDPNKIRPSEVKVASGGNGKSDQAFMEDEAERLFQLTKEQVKAIDDVPWDVLYQWQSYVEELDVEYWEQFRRSQRQCSGISYVRDERGGYIIDLDGIRLQRPCFAIPMLGGKVCAKHGGQVGHIREAAQRRLTHAAEKAATTLITLTNPRDELQEIVEQGVRVKAANSVLDRVGIKAGTTVAIEVPGYKNVLDRLFSAGDEEE